MSNIEMENINWDKSILELNGSKLDEICIELAGVRDQLFNLSLQLGKKDVEPEISSEFLSNVLSGIGYHVGRISADIDSISLEMS